jgi:hypothetical protein
VLVRLLHATLQERIDPGKAALVIINDLSRAFV